MAKKSEKKKIDWDYDSNHLFVQKLYRKRPFKLLRKISTAIASAFVFVLVGFYLAMLALAALAVVQHDWHWGIVFVLVALTVVLIPPVRAFFKRRKFFKTIKMHYGINGVVKTTILTKPYSTLFSASGKCDVMIETPETAYLIMFFPTANGSRRLMFSHDGKSVVSYLPVFLGKLGRMIGFKPRYKRIEIEFTAEQGSDKITRKILLLNPVPKEISVCDKNGGNIRISGPGERLGDYTIENIASLIRLIDNEIEE